MKTSLPVGLLMFVCSFFTAAAADAEWQEVKNANGIQVFTSATGEQDIVKVKTVAVINADLANVQIMLEDVQRYPEWVPYLSSVQILQQFSVRERLLYSQFSAPWPASDRDFVYRQEITYYESGVIHYEMQSEKSSLMPEQKGYVRAIVIESEYTLTPISDNQTRFEFIFHADPRGYLPVWVVNIIQQGFPYLALKQLKQQLESSGS